MKKIALKELYNLAVGAKEDLEELANGCDRPIMLYLHWTAGKYFTQFNDYHINIDGEGNIYVSTDDLSEVLAHTWKRNTGAIGITLDCAYEATTEDLGDYPPTEIQIEKMAQVVAVLAQALDIPIDIQHVMTHGEAADCEDGRYIHELYGPKNGCERWDIQYLGTEESPEYTTDYDNPCTGGNVIRGKAVWYKNQGGLV